MNRLAALIIAALVTPLVSGSNGVAVGGGRLDGKPGLPATAANKSGGDIHPAAAARSGDVLPTAGASLPTAGATPPNAPATSPGAGASPPNVLLITLDTTRADHLGCYGDTRARTPSLDRLAAEGTVADRAFAVAPMTLPSHASILTGRYPPAHGVRDNSDFRVPESETTLAEALHARGYATSAVVASIVLAGSLGLSQGFDLYDEPTPSAPAPGGGSGRRVLFSAIVDRRAAEVTDAALRILARARGHVDGGQGPAAGVPRGASKPASPFFLWVHYYDPHYEYAPPPPWFARFADRPYDGEIAYMDAEIGRLIDALRARDLLDRTLIAVTADHGEALGDHGEETHGLFLYDATVRVPLILRLPGKVAAGRRIADIVSGVDLAPTILDLLSAPPLPAANGTSFAPLVVPGGGAAAGDGRASGGSSDPGSMAPGVGPARTVDAPGERSVSNGERVVYSEALSAERLYGWSPLVALRSAGREFIDAPKPELYDRASDPAEMRNLASDRPEEIASWRGQLARVRASIDATRTADQRADSAARPDDEERREQLASLGYASSGAPGQARRTGADPKTLVATHNAFLRARWLVSAGRLSEARALVDRVLDADPGNPAALALSGMLLFAQGRRDAGLPRLEAAVLASPGVYENQRNLANAYHAVGRLADAARAYRAALTIQPQSGIDRFALGNVLFGMDDFTGAVREYREAIRLGYAPPAARAALGIALAAAGESAEAEKALEESVAADGSLAEAWDHLGRIAETTGRRDLARTRYERALAIAPRDPDILLDHGLFRLTFAGRFRAPLGRGERIDAAPKDRDGREGLAAAESDLERLRSIAPDDPRTLLLDGAIRAARGDPAGARAALESCRAHTRADKRLRDLAANALSRLGG